MVLWVLALMALMAAGFLSATRGEMLSVRARIDSAEAAAVADGAVYWAIERLLIARTAPNAEMEALPADGRAIPLDLPGGRAELRVQDAGGLVDLNAARAPLLQGLLTAVGVEANRAEALAARLIDFRDSDSRNQELGAEDPAYARAGRVYGARDAPLERVDELRQVLGFTPELVERLAPFVTTTSGARGIDPRLAPATVLAAVPGLNEAQRRRYLDARTAGTEPPGLAGQGGRGLVASSRSTFRIRALAETQTGGRFVRVAVIQLRSGAERYRVRRWDQGRTDTAAGG